jgi:predicted CXXCH cytochrome family protein
MMKKFLVAMALALVASVASAAITGSSHDFTGKTYGGGARCAYCHMPHNGSTVAGAPLFSRNINYTQAYTYFSSTSGGQAQPTQLGAGTRACLSCHDGTQSIAVVLAANGGGSQNISVPAGDVTKMGTINGGTALIGPALSNDHPVSITYTSVGNNVGGLNPAPPAAFNTGQGLMIECTSCHNAHNAKGQAASYPNRQFLVTIATDFCSGCHSTK